MYFKSTIIQITIITKIDLIMNFLETKAKNKCDKVFIGFSLSGKAKSTMSSGITNFFHLILKDSTHVCNNDQPTKQWFCKL